MADLYPDYLRQAPELAAFYARRVDDLAWGDELPAWDSTMRAALITDQERLGLEREIDPNSVAVVTGQQPGLLTGPLYTIYKAITALKLAQRVTAQGGRPAVPIFWVAADDHDFEEVRTAHLLGKEHAQILLRYNPAADVAAHPMHGVPCEASLHALVDHAAHEAPGAEFRESVRAFLHESLDASRSFSDWFSRIMARLFRNTPLLIFTTELPASRTVAAPIFAHEIRNPLESTRRLNAAGARLSALGYPPQVVKADDECSFFVIFDGRRRKVIFSDGQFLVPEEGTAHSEQELLDLLAQAPERFSANVALRPVVQQALFPTLAYIGGPGEVAYWGQFAEVFAHFGQPMPVVYPRAQARLSTLKLNKLLTKYGLDANVLGTTRDALLQRALESSVRSPALDSFRRGRDPILAASDALRDALYAEKRIDKNSLDVAEVAHAQIESTLDRLERALLRADASQTETARKQLERLCTALQPEGKPQERVYSVFSFLFEHGWDLIPRLIEAVDTDHFGTSEIEL